MGQFRGLPTGDVASRCHSESCSWCSSVSVGWNEGDGLENTSGSGQAEAGGSRPQVQTDPQLRRLLPGAPAGPPAFVAGTPPPGRSVPAEPSLLSFGHPQAPELPLHEGSLEMPPVTPAGLCPSPPPGFVCTVRRSTFS